MLRPLFMSWVAAAFASAFFAGITSILAKCGVHHTDSDAATAIRTSVVLVFAWVMAAVAGSSGQIGQIGARSWLFLMLSGLATGASWLLYYYAIAAGQVSVVVQVDKLSIVDSVLFARLAFKERLSRRGIVGLVLIVIGTAALTIWK